MSIEDKLAESHKHNCVRKIKMTPEEAAVRLGKRNEDHGFEIYICTHCNWCHFGHNPQERMALVLKRRRQQGEKHRAHEALMKQQRDVKKKKSSTPIADMIDRRKSR